MLDRTTRLTVAVLPLIAASGQNLVSAQGDQTPKPSVVRVEKTTRGYRLIRNGVPYFVKGAEEKTIWASWSKPEGTPSGPGEPMA